LFSRRAQTLAAVTEAGGIHLEGAAGEGFVAIDTLTSALSEAVIGADVEDLVVPTTAIEYYGAALAPLLADGQPVFLNPGHTGGALRLAYDLRRAGFDGDTRTCEVASLTSACQLKGPGG